MTEKMIWKFAAIVAGGSFLAGLTVGIALFGGFSGH